MIRGSFTALAVLAAGALLIAQPALAQDAPADGAAAAVPAEPPPNGDAGATPFKGDKMYRAFHERAGIERITSDLVDRNASDPRIADIFRNQDLPHIKAMLADQFCYILGGPCRYAGRDMRTTHRNMGVRVSDFNALVENLRKAMDKEGVNFRAQNRLLGKLAPQERVVVTR
jgi:hemoglobin